MSRAFLMRGGTQREINGINMDHAVILRPDDAEYIIDDFTEVEYKQGMRIGFAGTANKIIVQGYSFYPTASLAEASGEWHSRILFYKDPTLPVIESYLDDENISKFDMQITQVTSFISTGELTYVIRVVDENSVNKLSSLQTKDMRNTGMLLTFSAINPPNNNYPFGSINARIYMRYVPSIGSSPNIYTNSIPTTIAFKSLAEYNAALGLQYELVLPEEAEEEEEGGE